MHAPFSAFQIPGTDILAYERGPVRGRFDNINGEQEQDILQDTVESKAGPWISPRRRLS